MACVDSVREFCLRWINSTDPVEFDTVWKSLDAIQQELYESRRAIEELVRWERDRKLDSKAMEE